jgi:hypothetical protein
MNKTDIVEIMSRRSTNLVVLSTVFVGIMIVYLIPSMIESAEGVINARAISYGDSFS